MNKAFSVLILLCTLLFSAACSSSDGQDSDGDTDNAADTDLSDSELETSESGELEQDEEQNASDGDNFEGETEDFTDGDIEEETSDTDGDASEEEMEAEQDSETEDADGDFSEESEDVENAESDGDFEMEDEIEAEEDVPAPWFLPTAPAGLLVVNMKGTEENSLSAINISNGNLLYEAFVGNLSDLSPAKSLSVDLKIPSYPLPGNRMGVLDRSEATYTAFEGVKSYSVWQRNLHYDLNPQDLIVLSDGRAYISRYDTNPEDNPGVEWDSGDDIYIVSWPEAVPLGAIQLGAYASTVGGVQCKAHPRRMTAAWNLIWVALENSSADGSKWGDGKVLAVDPATNSVVYSHSIAGKHNCTDLDYMESLDQLVLVCGGNPGDSPQKNYSGVYGFSWNGSALSAAFSKPAEFIGIGPLAERLALYNEWAFVVVKPASGVNYGETVWGVNASNLGTISIFQTPQNGLIKSLLVEPQRGRLYFTDSAAKAVRQADLKTFPFTELNEQKIVTDSVSGGAPVEIGLY